MTSIYQLKSKFQNLLRPIVQKLAQAGITANQVTIFAAALSVLTGGALMFCGHEHWPWLLVPIVMFIRMALNAIDGMLAREHNMKTPLGAVLNELSDVISDAALYLPFMQLFPTGGWVVAVAVVLAVISEMAGVVAVQIGASRRYDGPMGKSDRAFVFGAMGLWIGLGFSEAPLFWVIGITCLLTLWTVLNRARSALGELKNG